MLSLEDGKQELNKGKALRDNWGLFRNLSANLLSSNGGFRMNLFGGILFFGETTFLRSASSLRSLWGLFWGSSCGSNATARIRNFGEVGVEIWGVLRWVWKGKGEKEDEKERSGLGWGLNGEQSSMDTEIEDVKRVCGET